MARNQAWGWKWAWAREMALPVALAPPQEARISIAVLPLRNVSGDPEQEYFSDGITEDLITALRLQDAGAVAAAIVELLGEPDLKARLAPAFERARARYTWERAAAPLLAVGLLTYRASESAGLSRMRAEASHQLDILAAAIDSEVTRQAAMIAYLDNDTQGLKVAKCANAFCTPYFRRR